MAKQQTITEKPPPSCRAILLCATTSLVSDPVRLSLIDIIGTYSLREFPGKTGLMRIYMDLVDGIGDYQITIQIIDLADDRLVARAIGPIVSFPDRIISVKLVIPIPSLPIFHPGRYDVVVLGDGQEIDRQQFQVALGEYEGVAT